MQKKSSGVTPKLMKDADASTNFAWPSFPLNLLQILQQMNDEEILKLWKI